LASSKEAIAGHVSVKVRILSSAFTDLVDGRVFYDSQGEYLGDYFFNTLSFLQNPQKPIGSEC
jgi:hypothetical protein